MYSILPSIYTLHATSSITLFWDAFTKTILGTTALEYLSNGTSLGTIALEYLCNGTSLGNTALEYLSKCTHLETTALEYLSNGTSLEPQMKAVYKNI